MTTAIPEPKQRDKKKKTAFISAAFSTNTAAIRRVLERQGIEAITADQMIMPGSNLSDILQEAMGRADVVFAVIDNPVNSNVIYELGFAQALKKRILIFVDPDVESAFMPVLGGTFLRTKLDNIKVIELGVSQVLKAPHHGTSEAVKQTKAIGSLADKLLAEIRGNLEPTPEMRLEEIILEAIRASGITATSERAMRDSGADIAVWSEDLEPWIVNPLLIEIRLNIRTKEELTRVTTQLEQMKRARAAWGLLVYWHAEFDVWGEVPQQILPISVEKLLESMREKSFAEVITQLRNQRIHGVS